LGLILAKQTGCFAPGCKFNFKNTDVFLHLSGVGQIQAPALRVIVDFLSQDEDDLTSPYMVLYF